MKIIAKQRPHVEVVSASLIHLDMRTVNHTVCTYLIKRSINQRKRSR